MKIKPLKNLTMPDLPSEGIRVCIKDLEMIEKDDRYEVTMEEWHMPYESDGKCDVCLGGARLARYYNDPKLIASDRHFMKPKIQAMNYFRMFEWNCGITVYLHTDVAAGNFSSQKLAKCLICLLYTSPSPRDS